MNTDLGAGYPRKKGSEPHFVDQYGAVPQKILLGNAEDDPGLFLTRIEDNLGDQRYLPFEGAGAISTWHLEIPPGNNEIKLAEAGDVEVVLHVYYNALDGGETR